jgi:hypothetical protein
VAKVGRGFSIADLVGYSQKRLLRAVAAAAVV